MKKEQDSSRKLKDKALDISIKEGTAANISASFGDSYIIPFALALKASPMHIGILSSFSGFLTQISQFFGSGMMTRYSRKKIVIWFVFLQAILWLSIAFVALAVWKHWFNGYSIWILIIAYSLLSFLGGVAYPAWFSWMGDLVPENKRGEYFSKRNRIASAVGLVAVLLAALFLDYYKTKGYLLLAFSILFALAFLARFISYLLFHKQHSPKFMQKKEDYFSLWAFLKRYDNFGKFAVYQGFFNLAVMIASPFFSVYMLEELKFSYTTFTIATVSYTLFYLLFLPLAGKFSDRYGNKKLTMMANVFFVLTPIFFIFTKSPLAVILLPQLSSGIANAASVISFSNFTYDAVSPRHRSYCITYTNILSGIGILIGSLIGGLIVSQFHPATINPYIFVFIVAAAARLAVAIIFLPGIKEVRVVRKLPTKYAFFIQPINFLHAESIKILSIPEKIFGKFKSLKFLEI